MMGFVALLLSAWSVQPRAEVRHALSVLYSSAVAGSPAKGTYRYASNRTVRYRFTLAKGFKDLRVIIDGKLAPPSGSLSMTADHRVWAYASARSGMVLENAVTVPTDITSITYPEFYSKQPAARVTVKDPFCTLASDTVSFPASYLGAFRLPEIRGAPLPNGIRRGVALKDYWQNWMNNPSGVLYAPFGPSGVLKPFAGEKPSCKVPNGLLDAFDITAGRFKRLGADHMDLFPAYGLVSGNDPGRGINSVPGGGGIPRNDMKKLIEAAKAKGLKTWITQWALIASNDNVVPPARPSRDWITAFFASYGAFIVDQARFAQANGVEAFDMAAGLTNRFDWSLGEDIFTASMIGIANQVRAVYSGKIIFSGWDNPLGLALLGNQAFRRNIDLLFGGVGVSFPVSGYANSVSVASIKSSLSDYFEGLQRYLTNTGIDPSGMPPIIYLIQGNSFYSALSNGAPFVDDSSGCAPDGTGDCLQNRVVTDFSIQAITMEALLEFFATQDYVPVYSLDSNNYWHTDTIIPVPCNNLKAVCGFFPNLSASIRNKPAEVILYKWFRRGSGG